MNFLDKITPGEVMTAAAFLVSIVIFVYTMKPRIDGHDKQFATNDDWKMEHEKQTRDTLLEHNHQDRERDSALEKLAVSMATLAETTAGLTHRLGRMENFLLDLSLEKRKQESE